MNFHAYKNTFVTRTLTFVALFSLIACLFVVSTSVHALSDHLVLSEVVVDVTGVESAGEMVEIYNPTGDTVDIGGWDIAYKTATGSSFSGKATIPTGSDIGPYGFYLVGGDNVSPTPDHIDTSLGFAATGGHVALRDASNTIIDKLGYGTALDPEGSAAPAPGQDKSLERDPGDSDPLKGNGEDSDNNQNDFQIRNTPEPQNTSSATEVPDFGDSTAGTITINLASLYGSGDSFVITVTDTDLNTDSTTTQTVNVTVTSVDDPTGISVVLTEVGVDSNGFQATISASSDGSDDGADLIGVANSGDTITATYQDAAPSATLTAEVTFLWEFKIRVVEMMIDPNGTEPDSEWIEILNLSGRSIDISSWKLQDSLDGTTNAGEGVFTFPAGTTLDTNARVVLGSSNLAAQEKVDIVYGDSDAGVIFFNQQDTDEVVFVNPNGAIHEAVIYSVDWWTITENFTLERIDDVNQSSDSSNWQTSLVEGGTPREGSSFGEYVKINEVVFNPSGSDGGNEWVELYNAGIDSVSLASWTLTDEDASTVMVMPNDVTLPNGAYLVWYVDASGTNDTDFTDGSGTIYSGTTTTVSLTNTNDQVALYDSTVRNSNTLVDFMQYSTNGSIDQTDAQNAVDKGIWPKTDTFVDATAAPEGAGLILLPDGDEGNIPDDWSIDSTPTEGISNGTAEPPIAPTSLVATGGIEKVDLTWTGSTEGSDPLAGYRVFRGTSATTLSILSTLVTATSYLDTTGSTGVTYYYGVVAEDDNGLRSDTSNIDSATSVAYVAPGTPVNLVAAGNPFQNDLSWDTPSTGSYPHQDFLIYRSQTSGVYGSPLETITAPVTVYPDTNISVGQQYFYVVRVSDTSGVLGDSSSEVSVVAQGYADPPAPGNNIQINEIAFDVESPEPDSEWVELFNPTDTPISIGSMYFEDNIGSFQIPEGNTVPAQGYFVLGYSVGAANGNVDLVYGMTASNIQLSNSGDTVTLRTDTAIIDQVGYQTNWNGGEPYTLQRKFSGLTSSERTTWGTAIDTNGTPGAANYVDTLPPLITHTPIAKAAAGRDLGIQAVITDNIAKEIELGDASLFYRTQGETTYTEIVMNRVSIDDWSTIIPGVDVETPVLEYYMWAIDPSNNVGSFATSDTPQEVTIVTIDTKIVINEIMYDPAENEPDNEWVEIYNVGNTSQDISGWQLTDGEDVFNIPTGTTIGAMGYIVFERTDSATTVTAPYALTYGDSAPSLKFQNVIGVITDQATLKDHNGLVVDEVNYSSSWGAHNVSDSKNTTLERVDPNGSSNSSDNWIHSYVVDGTPGDTNTNKMVRDFSMIPTLFDPENSETVTFSFSVHTETQTSIFVEIYDETGSLRHTIQLDTALDSGIYEFDTTWNGLDESGDTILGVLQIEAVANANNGQTSRHALNDELLIRTTQGIESGFDFRSYAKSYYVIFISKPTDVSVNLRDPDDESLIRNIWNDVPSPAGQFAYSWDGRNDSGFFVQGMNVDFDATPMVGNKLISRRNLELFGLEFAPRTSFNPESETQTIRFDLSAKAFISVQIRESKDGDVIREIEDGTLMNGGFKEISWNGKDDFDVSVADGLYFVEVSAIAVQGGQSAREFGEVYVRRVVE